MENGEEKRNVRLIDRSTEVAAYESRRSGNKRREGVEGARVGKKRRGRRNKKKKRDDKLS